MKGQLKSRLKYLCEKQRHISKLTHVKIPIFDNYVKNKILEYIFNDKLERLAILFFRMFASCRKTAEKINKFPKFYIEIAAVETMGHKIDI